MGASYLSASGGKVYWELRVVKAKGAAFIGFAGTSFRCGPQEEVLGHDKASWALDIKEGWRIHG